MKPERNNWLKQLEELNDVEASQINGGNLATVSASLQSIFKQQLEFKIRTQPAKTSKDSIQISNA